MKKLILLFTAILIINGCSSDDNSSSEQQDAENFNLLTESNTVIPYQLVVVSSDNLNFNQENYNATLGNYDVVLTKNDDGNLVFAIPDIPSADYELILNTQNREGKLSFTIGVNVVQDPDITINQEFFQPLAIIDQNINDFLSEGNLSIQTINNLNSAKLMYTNFINQYPSTSNEDKLILAKFFNANPIFTTNFDDAINRNASSRTMLSNNDFLCYIKNSARIAEISGAFVSWVTVVAPGIINFTGPIGIAIVGVATLVGVYYAAAEIEASIEQMREVCLRPITNHLYDEQGNSDNFIFNNNSFSNFNLKLAVRTSILSDINDSNTIVSEVIEKIDYILNKWSIFRNSINQVISDSNSWFMSWFTSSNTYEPITSNLEHLPESSPESEIDGNNAFVTVEGIPSGIITQIEIVGESGYNIKFNTDNATLPQTFVMSIKYDDGNFQTTDEFNVTLEEENNQIDIIGYWLIPDNSGMNCDSGGIPFNNDFDVLFNTNGTVILGGTSIGPYSLAGNQLNFTAHGEALNITYNCTDGSTLEADWNVDYTFNGTFDGVNFNGSLNVVSAYTPDIEPCNTWTGDICNGSITLTR